MPSPGGQGAHNRHPMPFTGQSPHVGEEMRQRVAGFLFVMGMYMLLVLFALSHTSWTTMGLLFDGPLCACDLKWMAYTNKGMAYTNKQKTQFFVFLFCFYFLLSLSLLVAEINQCAFWLIIICTIWHESARHSGTLADTVTDLWWPGPSNAHRHCLIQHLLISHTINDC